MCLDTQNPISQRTQNYVVRVQQNSTCGCKITLVCLVLVTARCEAMDYPLTSKWSRAETEPFREMSKISLASYYICLVTSQYNILLVFKSPALSEMRDSKL
jgi:hypothetical protein